jgi:hypothetical protein
MLPKVARVSKEGNIALGCYVLTLPMCISLKLCFHWQRLGQLEGRDTVRIISICVVSPKVARASKEVDIGDIFVYKLHQCTQAFTEHKGSFTLGKFECDNTRDVVTQYHPPYLPWPPWVAQHR